jgi:ComF family protein
VGIYQDALHSFLDLFFPNPCLGCGKNLGAISDPICLSCEFTLPKNPYHQQLNNPIGEKFHGFVPIDFVYAFLNFDKKTITQKLLHALKYHNAPQLGFYLGRMAGYHLKEILPQNEDFCLVPVPLHYKKFKKRGYNQSEKIAEGMSEVLEIPVISDGFIRTKPTQTQTKKKRFDRFENVSGLFAVTKPELLNDKHIILVDDVLTTGATLAACAETLLTSLNVKLSVAVLAATEN